MYAAGQIDPEFGVKDANKVNEDVGAGRFGMMFGDFWNMAWINDVKVKNPDFEWVPVAIPSLDGTTPGKSQLSASTTDFFVISAKCEHPEAVVRMLISSWRRVMAKLLSRKYTTLLRMDTDLISTRQFPLSLR